MKKCLGKPVTIGFRIIYVFLSIIISILSLKRMPQSEKSDTKIQTNLYTRISFVSFTGLFLNEIKIHNVNRVDLPAGECRRIEYK